MKERVFYVDSERGDDDNAGTAPGQAWKSLERVNRQTFFAGDRLLFCSGGKWSGTLRPCGDGEPFRPVVISSYGDGGRPLIDGAGGYAAVHLQGVSHYVVENLAVTNRAGDRQIRQGICVEGKAEGITEDVTVRFCEVFEVDGQNVREAGPYQSMYWNGGIYVTMPGRSSQKNHLHRIHIFRNHIHDVKTSGIRVNQEEDFINDIHHTCVVVRGNLIERTGSDGIIVANCISPLIDGNRCLDAGALGVPEETRLLAGIWVCATSDALIQHNEVARTRMFSDDGTAFDTDWGTAGTTVFQYNYSHDNEGGFWLDCSSLNYNREYHKTVLRYNISLRDGRGVAVYDKGLDAEFYGNVFAFDREASLCVWDEGESFLFRNNLFRLEKEPEDGWSQAAFLDNRYEASVCPREQGEKPEERCEESGRESREERGAGGLDAAWLLANAQDGTKWLDGKWELLCGMTMGKTGSGEKQ
ncbi:MAG: right-handed parallel beta-helix repeat-containing protein [Eubacteriales bacterium]|nr:right-handed parallel beta-helix repeat-containing protein [Eubacteriales bacterium]